MNQNDFAFGRKMDPFDYEAGLAKEGENCVVITAYDNKKKEKEEKEEEISK